MWMTHTCLNPNLTEKQASKLRLGTVPRGEKWSSSVSVCERI